MRKGSQHEAPACLACRSACVNTLTRGATVSLYRTLTCLSFAFLLHKFCCMHREVYDVNSLEAG